MAIEAQGASISPDYSPNFSGINLDSGFMTPDHFNSLSSHVMFLKYSTIEMPDGNLQRVSFKPSVEDGNVSDMYHYIKPKIDDRVGNDERWIITVCAINGTREAALSFLRILIDIDQGVGHLEFDSWEEYEAKMREIEVRKMNAEAFYDQNQAIVDAKISYISNL